MNLATRLLLLVCLAVMPALGVLAYNNYDLRQTRATELRGQAERSVAHAAAEARISVEEVRRLSSLAAKLPDVRAAASETGFSRTCSDLLVALRHDHPGQLEFAVANADGSVVCTTGEPMLAATFEGAEARRAMEANGFVVGRYRESRASVARYLTFAYPVRDHAGAVTGAVLTALDLRWLADRMRPFAGPEQSVLSVHDRDLVFLARVPDDGGLIGKKPPPRVQALSSLANTGAMEATGADGRRRVGAILSLDLGQDRSGKPDLYVAFGLSRDAAFEAIDAETRRNLALLLLSLVLAVIAAWYGGRHFVRGPVDRLLAAAGRWREGDLGARVRLKDRSSEFGRLAAAYEEMADTLGRRNMQRDKAEQELRSSEERLRLAQDAGGIGLWDWNIPAGTVVWSKSYRRVWKLGPDVQPSFSAFLDHVHPEDRSRAKEDVEAALAGQRPLNVELRTRDDGGVRWVAIKGEVISDQLSAKPLRMIGICQDVTDRKRAEEHQRLLINELNHRVKNTLATVQSVAAQSLKNSADPEQARASFEARLLALSRTHDVLTRENWESASILEMVAEAIAPFSHGEAAGRFRIEGPALRLPPGVVLPISMALHELCTNAAKYGALSNDGGRVEIKWEATRRPEGVFLLMQWVESGGPLVREPSRRGFGSRLIERGLARQVGGEVELRFEPTGVVCTIDLPLVGEASEPARGVSRRGLYVVQ
jgi:two-component sensor histidine kinase